MSCRRAVKTQRQPRHVQPPDLRALSCIHNCTPERQDPIALLYTRASTARARAYTRGTRVPRSLRLRPHCTKNNNRRVLDRFSKIHVVTVTSLDRCSTRFAVPRETVVTIVLPVIESCTHVFPYLSLQNNMCKVIYSFSYLRETVKYTGSFY